MARDPYRRQMRRMRRTMRKNGDNPYAVLIVGPGEPFGLIVLAVIGRWAYRHRSAFYPFWFALAAFIAASAAHGHHARWWIPVTAITAVTTILLAFPHSILRRHPAGRRTARVLAWIWEKCRIDRAAERAYAGTVIATAGGWLAAAIANGPAAKPLPLTALTATVILAVPWWFHRRRRAKVRIERAISGWPDIAGDIGLPGSRIANVVVDAWGWTARVLLRKGTTVAQAIAKIPDIESGLELRPGSVRIFSDGKKANRLTMRVVETEPLAEPIPWPGPSITSVTQLAEIGLTEDGRPARVLLLRRNVLIGGIAGSGKSGILNIIIAILAACRDVRLWGVDLKGGMELGPWESCFERLATTPEDANQLFRDAVAELNKRAARMTAEGKRLWEPAPEDPALVIITDEHAELPDESHDCADSVARRGRAVAVNLVAATQRPTQAAMGRNTAVRSQMDIRICLRVREPRDADLILGQGSVNSGWHAHKLTQPGEFLISDPGHAAPERNRAYLLTDERRDAHAARYAHPRTTQPGSGPDTPRTAPEPPQTDADGPARDDDQPTPETALWDALSHAGPEGVSVAELQAACGMARRWVYYRLSQHGKTGRAVQVRRGYWRAVRPGGGRPPARPGDGRPPGRPGPRRTPGSHGQ
jgi:DNA segregation ATPase FtsK/SpoIIIE, S-DNA-T family